MKKVLFIAIFILMISLMSFVVVAAENDVNSVNACQHELNYYPHDNYQHAFVCIKGCGYGDLEYHERYTCHETVCNLCDATLPADHVYDYDFSYAGNYIDDHFHAKRCFGVYSDYCDAYTDPVQCTNLGEIWYSSTVYDGEHYVYRACVVCEVGAVVGTEPHNPNGPCLQGCGGN